MTFSRRFRELSHSSKRTCPSRGSSFDFGLVAHRSRGEPGLTGEDRMIDHPPRVLQRLSHLGREREVGDKVAVQMSQLPAAYPEAELASWSWAGLNSGPRTNDLGDPLTCPLHRRHGTS